MHMYNIDPRAKSLGESWQLHENKVFTVRVNEVRASLAPLAPLELHAISVPRVTRTAFLTFVLFR
eukprot:1335709-Amorphochlora_amoeboformis.AAC.1